MAVKSDLQEVEILNSAEEGHLVADLPLTTIFSTALLLPFAIALASVIVARMHRAPIQQISSLQIAKQSSPNISVNTGISDITPANRFLSLSLHYQTDHAKSVLLSSQLTFYTTDEDTYPSQSWSLTREGSPDQVLNIFKTRVINYSKVSLTGDLQSLIPGSAVTILWQLGDPLGFAFIAAIRLLTAVGSISLLLDIYRKLDRDGLNSLDFSQSLTYGLVIASLFYYNPSSLFFLTNPSPIEEAIDKLFRDTFFALFLTYSILIFVPFVTDDLADHRLYIAPYFLGLFYFSFSLLQLVFAWEGADPVFFPPFAIENPSRLFRLVLIVIYFFVLGAYVSLALGRIKNSTENRFWYYTIVNALAFVAICVYEVIGAIEAVVFGNAVHAVMPAVGVLMYTSVVFHGQRETEVRSVFERQPAEGVDLMGDNSIGIEENQVEV
jgi:hypothetical protein